MILGTSLPFARFVMTRDKPVGLLAPVYCLLRAVVFAMGSLGGTLSVLGRKVKPLV